jgi:tetratricopeptide (TPR) repeat protein
VDRPEIEEAYEAQLRGPGGIAAFFEVAERLRPGLDARGLFLLHKGSARAFGVLGDMVRAREEARSALEYDPEDVYCTYLLANLDLEGAAPVTDCLRLAKELLPRGQALTAFGLQALAECNAMLGRFEEARGYVREHAALTESAGRSRSELGGQVELLAGDPAAAEEAVRQVVEDQEAEGDLGHGAGSLAVLARAVLLQGRVDDALELVDKLDTWADEAAVVTQADRSALRGLATGDAALVRDAVALLEPTEYLNARAQAWLDLHTVTGEGAEHALELYERKGNAVGARLARELVERGE